MKTLISAALATVCVCAGCVQADRFRYVRRQPSCFGSRTATDPVPGANGEKRDWPSLDCRHRDYAVGFIEFDKHGKAIDPNQADKAIALIEHEKRIAPAGKIITLVYVHGWKNNADQALPGREPKDVERFESALTELAYRSSLAQVPGERQVPVVGVYIGWPGKSLMGPGWFTFVSYWGRRNTANQVGDGPDLAPILNRVIDATNQGNGTSRVMLVGHSFGARVLEHAIATEKVKLYDEVQGGVVNPRVDLTLYVNSANDSRLSLAMVEKLRAQPKTLRHPDFNDDACSGAQANAAQCRPYPLLVAITSRGDLATKYLLPIANTLNGDKIDKGLEPSPPSGTFADPLPSPGTYKRAAAAHLQFMQSHAVQEISCPARRASELRKAVLACGAADTKCQFTFRTLGELPTCYQVDDRRSLNPPPFNTTAFWIMAVEKNVIDDHGDIWNQSFIQMLGALMSPRGFFEPGVGRMQLRSEPVRP